MGYVDRIVYCVIQTDVPLGEIPLVCITKIIEYPDKKKNRFNIIMGSWRTFELQATTPSIANDWIQTLKSMIGRYSKEEQNKMLQKQKDKFWKIDSVLNEQQQYKINNKFGNFKPNTKPQQPPYQQYNNQQQPYRNDNNGYSDNILREDEVNEPTKHKKLKDSKHKKLKFGHHIKDK